MVVNFGNRNKSSDFGNLVLILFYFLVIKLFFLSKNYLLAKNILYPQLIGIEFIIQNVGSDFINLLHVIILIWMGVRDFQLSKGWNNCKKNMI